MSRTALYRHFDAAGTLLYVGISLNSIQRTAQHRYGAGWFEQIARITVEWLPDRSSALAAESYAIQEENPVWNVVRAKRPPPPKQVHAVVHERSGRRCGWFRSKEDAADCLLMFRNGAPHDKFHLISELNGRAPFIPNEMALRTIDAHLWMSA